MKKLSVEEIRAIADKYTEDYEYVCVRTQEQPFELGEITHMSVQWIDGEESVNELNGICATGCYEYKVKMHSSDKSSGHYYGDHVAIIVSNIAKYGEDDGEYILEDATVVEILS